MEFSVGDVLRVDGEVYNVVGKIRYRNQVDNCLWDEYRLFSQGTSREKWLSIDTTYNEYSISEATWNASTNGYHEVDQGVEIVVGAWGNVDVDMGERASFTEYEDVTEEKIVSYEVWEDGTETSTGYYLDANEIQVVSHGASATMGGQAGFQSGVQMSSGGDKAVDVGAKIVKWMITILVLFSVGGPILGAFSSSRATIAKYLEKTTSTYTYTTSVTGEDGEKADVYKSILSLDATAKDIINAIDGNTTDVQQNEEDGDESIAIMTTKEYCLVYMSEDESEVLVQVSTRKFAYTNDSQPYHSSRYTHRYYRRFYYSRGYSNDSTTYTDYSSPYGGFDDDPVSYNTTDTYSSYSSSVRQASARSRSSSGGGFSGGK